MQSNEKNTVPMQSKEKNTVPMQSEEKNTTIKGNNTIPIGLEGKLPQTYKNKPSEIILVKVELTEIDLNDWSFLIVSYKKEVFIDFFEKDYKLN